MLRSVDFRSSGRNLLLAVVCGFGLAACSGGSSDDGGETSTETAPGVATNFVATAGDEQVVFTFDAPASGGIARQYTVTCEATDEATVSRFSASSPVTISGMVNDVEYSCTIVATNNGGDGPASDPVLVTPNTGFEEADCTLETTDAGNITCLTNNLMAGYTRTQRNASLYELTEANATDYWSTFRPAVFPRRGVPYISMTDEQLEDANALAEAVFSAAGLERYTGIRSADEFLGDTLTGFSSGLYYFSVLGTPSATDPWILVITGHNYTLFASVEGDFISLTPNFIGVEPPEFTLSDEDFAPLADRKAALLAVIDSLTDAELATAALGETFDDILAGPRADNAYPDPQEGVAVSDLTADQRALIVAAIQTFSDDQVNTPLTAEYTTDAALDGTFIATAGETDLTTQGSYIRIDGPRVWLEFIVIPGTATSDDYIKTIWRDKQLDYGGNFDLTDDE